MTRRPTLALISDDSPFLESLSAELGEALELVALSQHLGEHGPWDEQLPDLFLIDGRNVDDGGHAIGRLLDKALERADSQQFFLLSDGLCPEPLERRIACSQIVHLREPIKVSEIARQLIDSPLSLKDSRTARITPSTREADHKAPQCVMDSVTGRFESRSASLRRMLDDLAIAADHDVTILLIGETGSGKTYLSRLIHEASSRRDEPFLHVACGALPRELIESELFGHTKGSFTSAHADKDGKFVAAKKGTVLLDEIDVLAPEQQVKLLKVIETGEFEPVGSNQTLRLQARLVVASNLDLQPLVDQGRFRPDLYYRLNMMRFEIPPLRKRRVDIIPLAKCFIRKFQQKHNTPISRVDDGLLQALVGYSWPGNVRELENVIQRAIIYCRDGVLTARQLPQHIVSGAADPANDPSLRPEGCRPAYTTTQSLGRQIALTEREIIEQALFRNDHSKTKTAKALGISRVTLYNKLKKLKIAN